MAPSETQRPTGDHYYVLKNGGMHGPFTKAELEQRFTSGILAMEDFVQAEGVPIWQPLARVLGNEGTIPHGAIAPDWKSLATWVWLRLRYDIDEQSLVTGWVCLGIGLVALFLSHWTFIFWLPWMLAALLAALALWQRRRVVAGSVLLAAAVLLPLLFLALEPKPKSDPQPAVVETAETPPAAPEPPRSKPAVDPAPEIPLEPIALPPKIDPTPAPAAPLAEEKPAAPGMVASVAKFFSDLRQPAAVPPAAVEAKTPPAPTGGDFVQKHRKALVVVKDRGNSGSGFIAKSGAETWLFTNIHVAAGMAQPQFTGIDGTQLKPGAAAAAVGHDALRLILAQAPPEALEIMTALEATAKIGDPVVVLGNSGGGGVITSLAGEIIGIGPDRIEVSAAFIPGNSGSPIIHVPSGKVIGIATYLTRRYEAFAGGDAKPGATPAQDAPGAVVVRRFGYRLDSVKQWQSLNWVAFQNEARAIGQISSLTGDVFDFLDALRKNEAPRIATATLRRPAETWLAAINRTRISEADRDQATRSFLSSLRSLVRSDVAAAQGKFRYAYFQDVLRQERAVRDRLYKAFDDQAIKMSTPQMGRSR